jgi:uncharacterized protein YraI
LRCPSAPPVRLIVQERARVSDNDRRLNLREGPGVDYEVLLLIEPGTIVFVIDGPACAGEFTWFRILYRGRTGWVAEGDAEEYYILPYLTE